MVFNEFYDNNLTTMNLPHNYIEIIDLYLNGVLS